MTPDDRLWTIADVAAFLRVPKSWVYARTSTNTLPFPCLRVGHHVRFRREDVEKFLEREAQKAAGGNVRRIGGAK
jgi:excisionase family DNA binding protein